MATSGRWRSTWAEILDGLSQTCIDFLIDTSVLERFCPALCDAVRQRNDSAEIIKALETANVFLVPLDRTGDWYRYHRFFAAFLQGECRRRRDDIGAVLHARASRWWERHGDRDSAVRHAYAGGDLDRFERLVWSATPSYLTNNHTHELAAWLELPTPEQVAASPRLSIATAWLTALNADETEALTANLAGSDDARLSDGTPLRAELALLSAVTARRGVAQALVDATFAYEAIDSRSPWKAFACLFAGIALRHHERALQAEAVLQEGLQPLRDRHARPGVLVPGTAGVAGYRRRRLGAGRRLRRPRSGRPRGGRTVAPGAEIGDRCHVCAFVCPLGPYPGWPPSRTSRARRGTWRRTSRL